MMPSRRAMKRVAVVCEGQIDFDVATGLVERMLVSRSVPGDLASFDGLGTYVGDGGHAWWKWASIPTIAAAKRIRVPHGHFDGLAGAPDAAAARRAIHVLKATVPPLDVVILIRDSDGQVGRRRGLEQARTDHPHVSIGIADTKMECWILAGFDAISSDEMAAYDTVYQELSFCPVRESQRLRASDDRDARSAKRVLVRLLGSDPVRKRRCWMQTAISDLRGRGQENGLAAFLDEIQTRVLPLLESAQQSPEL